MKKLFLLKWGTPKENYENFQEFVQKMEVNPFAEKKQKRSDNLAKNLWENFTIVEIERILKDFADFETRKTVFEKYVNFMDKNCILLWHSLWASFFLKYLNEKNMKIEFAKLILIAPALNTANELIWSFAFDQSLKNIQDIQEKIVVFGSKDDFLVDFKDIEILQKSIPKAEFHIFENKGHFLQEDFTELTEKIKLL